MLDGYYVPTIYPNSLPADSIPARVYTHDGASDDVGLDNEIVEFARNKIGLQPNRVQ